MRMAKAIVSRDAEDVSRLLAGSPELAKSRFEAGATRDSESEYYVERIGKHIYKGDTPVHIAAAAYATEIVRQLIAAGADVQAKNRMGSEALHAAAKGHPGSHWWNPSAQAATIRILIQAGADPNTVDKRGVTALHVAVRTRCAEAVRTLLEHGADPVRKNKSGSTPMLLARLTTGRGGSGSMEAKEQQLSILRYLEERGA